MKNEFGYVHWLGEEDCLSCQGALFWASSPTDFSANGSIGICRCACARRNFTMDQLTADDMDERQLMPDGRFGRFNLFTRCITISLLGATEC